MNSPISGHLPYFSLVFAYGNNSRKRTALLTDTFFNSRGCPLTGELTVLKTGRIVTIDIIGHEYFALLFDL